MPIVIRLATRVLSRLGELMDSQENQNHATPAC